MEQRATTFNLHNTRLTWPDGAEGIVHQPDGPAKRDTANSRQLFIGYLEVTHAGHEPVHGTLMIGFDDHDRVEHAHGGDTSAPVRTAFQQLVEKVGLSEGFRLRIYPDDGGVQILPVNAEGR